MAADGLRRASAASRIVFASDRNGSMDIWTMDGDGSDPTQLTTNPGLDEQPVPSPDGQRIAYVCDAGNPGYTSQEPPHTDVWVMNSDGSAKTRLSSFGTHHCFQPTWSPDGGQIVFAAQGALRYLYGVESDGSSAPVLLEAGVTSYGIARYNPEFSPDGAYIVYDCDSSGGGWWDQYRRAMPNGPEEPLATASHSLGGGYSHAGDRIAYIQDVPPASQVRMMNADGSNNHMLIDNYAIAYDGWGQATWSPGDTLLAVSVYSSQHPGAPDFSQFIQILDPNTGAELYRTTSGRNMFALENSWYNNRRFVAGSRVWSSDGTRLVFMSKRDGDWEVYTMAADGSAQTNLTQNAAYDGDPCWIAEGSTPAALAVTKSPEAQGAAAGAVVSFTLRCENVGAAAADSVVLTDSLDPLFAFVSASDGGIHDPGTRTVTWPLGDLAAGAAAEVTLAAEVMESAVAGTAITNQATLSAANAGPVLSSSAVVRVGIAASKYLATLVFDGTDWFGQCERFFPVSFEFNAYAQDANGDTLCNVEDNRENIVPYAIGRQIRGEGETGLTDRGPNDQRPAVYVRYLEGYTLDPQTHYEYYGYAGDGQTYDVIQYWLYYADNDWLNDHEHDWEHYSILLQDNEPKWVEAGHHLQFRWRPWDDASLETEDDSHLVLSVEGGSHATKLGDQGREDGLILHWTGEVELSQTSSLNQGHDYIGGWVIRTDDEAVADRTASIGTRPTYFYGGDADRFSFFDPIHHKGRVTQGSSQPDELVDDNANWSEGEWGFDPTDAGARPFEAQIATPRYGLLRRFIQGNTEDTLVVTPEWPEAGTPRVHRPYGIVYGEYSDVLFEYRWPLQLKGIGIEPPWDRQEWDTPRLPPADPDGVTITAFGPADLCLAVYPGAVIDSQRNSLPGATYAEVDLNGDGVLDDQIIVSSPVPQGSYRVDLIPHPDAEQDDLVTVVASAPGTVIPLVTNMPTSELLPIPIRFGVYRDGAVSQMFSDVPPQQWGYGEIENCSLAGVVAGYGDGTYLPQQRVSRDQMAVYISRALAGGDERVPDFAGTPTFPDVSDDDWALDYVEYAVKQGVVAGYEDGTYRPEHQVTRDQMAAYIARAMVAPAGEAALAEYVPAAPRSFADVPADLWACRHIEYCVENGVVEGYPDGSYRPGDVVTRDQMAVYVARAFRLVQ
jgi:uncharacterized repeat protein (TIGR01451 family)